MQWVELIREYHWSWQEYEQTPLYVRRVFWDLMMARRNAENNRAEP